MGLTLAQREYIDCFIKCLPDCFDGMYSIDFLPLPDGRLIFDEVEEMVGCRMLYQYTEHDIISSESGDCVLGGECDIICAKAKVNIVISQIQVLAPGNWLIAM